jgi:hypothetical protein
MKKTESKKTKLVIRTLDTKDLKDIKAVNRSSTPYGFTPRRGSGAPKFD